MLIDVGTLTEKNCKRTSALPIFADLDGFTRYVQEAEDDDAVVSLVRQFHMIRTECNSVLETDYEGLVIQHQGDRIFGIVHIPTVSLDVTYLVANSYGYYKGQIECRLAQ